jgi:dimethylhistidine N-methyltransferase
MIQSTDSAVLLHDLEPVKDDFRAEVLAGLRRPRKQLPCKFFYDQRGSELFDQICELDEYYLTRAETAILFRHASEIASVLGRDCLLIEYGSGSSLKTRILLDHLDAPAGYVPIDISRAHLLRAAQAIRLRHPRLHVTPVCADYTEPLDLPACPRPPARKVVFFPGSTIGNFDPWNARHFLAQARALAGPGSGLLIGVDLKKDPRVLHSAYNDAAGVTADFNLNLLARINRELGANFDVNRFAHYAFFNPAPGRVEMHLRSLEQQTVHISGESFHFTRGESIFTESSYKYTIEGFTALAAEAGYRQTHCWTDAQQLFAVLHLIAH